MDTLSRKSIVSVVKQFVVLEMAHGSHSIEGTAHALGISVRSLQRRLRGAEASYTQIVEEVRLAKACDLLVQTETKISDIASTLGYADPSCFTRAFMRWTGETPRVYRTTSKATLMRGPGDSNGTVP